MKLLGIYRSDSMKPMVVSIPDGLVDAVEKALSGKKDLIFKGRVIPNRLIINQNHLFDSIEEYRSVKQMLTPSEAEAAVEIKRQKTMEEMRQELRSSDWYRKSRKQQREL